MVDALYRLTAILDTPSGHILICLALVVYGHFVGDKSLSELGTGGMLLAMRSQTIQPGTNRTISETRQQDPVEPPK